MLFAGFSVAQGGLTLAGIVFAGVVGNLVGSLGGYAIGYFGRLDLLERNRLFHVSEARLRQTEGWLERYGSAAGSWRWRCSVARSATTGKSGATTSATSTT